ncbi:AAA domain-containing protein [Podospora australis]|uniref:AAA domain-containing protein n=1 Tax=Podospora australis TaxID=1536484 RepID=A0AAN7ADW6_9PEZI|nr:AAA domain-containing protein [Podospora australis]
MIAMTEHIGPRNIYIIGAQCTGKTTLVRNLSQHPELVLSDNPPTIITEVARTVLQEHSFTAQDVIDPIRTLELQRLILQAQYSAEKTALNDNSGTSWFISDRSGMDPIVYARKYVAEELWIALLQSPEWIEMRERMILSTVIVCEAGGEAQNWLVDDGVRLMPQDEEDWIKVDEGFYNLLDREEIPYHVLSSSISGHPERIEFVVGHWKGAR